MLISKSRYLSGIQCQKLLWYYYNARDQIPPVGPATQAIFDQGHLVGRLAQSLFPQGIEISGDPRNFSKLFEETKLALGKGKPIFEGAFQYGQGFARADILNPVGDGSWDIIEVKSSTQVKDVNFPDLALQRYVIEGSGLKVRKCILMHINNEYTRNGEIDAKNLFVQEEITDRVQGLLSSVELKLHELSGVIRLKSAPDIPIGPHCTDPYDCILRKLCWKHVPDDSPLSLSRINGDRAFELVHEDILSIKELPASFQLSEKQEIQVRAARSGRAFVDKAAMREFLGGLKYPLYFLDFETFGTAIPLFDNVRPYQPVPFQFSLQVLRSAKSKTSSTSYLAWGNVDPRPEFLARLQEGLGDAGSIIAYNASFEKRILNEAVEYFDEYEAWNSRVQERIVDLIIPFRSFAYYHPKQYGSASLKAVLPVLTGVSYEHLPIADGDTASREYLRITFGSTDGSERQQVRQQLEEYCHQDTMGMVKIIEKLYEITE